MTDGELTHVKLLDFTCFTETDHYNYHESGSHHSLLLTLTNRMVAF